MPAAAYWDIWFASLPDYDIGNRDCSVYAGAWSQESDHDEKIQIITADPGAVILAADANKQIIALHSFKNFGGTRLRPANNFACLIGGSPSAPIVSINKQSITADCSIATPTIATISNCTSALAIRNLPEPGDLAAVTFAGCTSFYGQPWLIEASCHLTAVTPSTSFASHSSQLWHLTTPIKTTLPTPPPPQPMPETSSSGLGG